MSRIDYDLRLIKGVAFDMDGVLSGSTVNVGPDGNLCRTSNVKDGYAIQYALRHGLCIAVISGAKDESMRPAYRSLGLTDVYFGCSEKRTALNAWMKERGLCPEEVAYVGDDIPDLEVMEIIGLPVTPRDGAIEVKRIARYISPVKGGEGVARDLISQILSARGEWMLEEDRMW